MARETVATETFAWQAAQKWAGVFNAGGEAADGHTPEEVYNILCRNSVPASVAPQGASARLGAPLGYENYYSRT